MKVSSFPRVIHEKIRKKNNSLTLFDLMKYMSRKTSQNREEKDLLFPSWHYFQFPVARR